MLLFVPIIFSVVSSIAVNELHNPVKFNEVCTLHNYHHLQVK